MFKKNDIITLTIKAFILTLNPVTFRQNKLTKQPFSVIFSDSESTYGVIDRLLAGCEQSLCWSALLTTRVIAMVWMRVMCQFYARVNHAGWKRMITHDPTLTLWAGLGKISVSSIEIQWKLKQINRYLMK